MSRFRSRYEGRARNNEFRQFDNPFFANPAPLARIAERSRKAREIERRKARRQKNQAFDY